MEEKKFIKNRKDQKISVLVDVSPHQKGLAIVMHGLGGFKEQPHIRVFADSFKEDGFTVIRFDATNTLGSGESYGKYDDATATNYYEDLDDVMTWAKKQPWYQEPFWLAGHSLGGMSIILFAEKYPQKIKALAPISTAVSGKLYLNAPKYRENDLLKKWKETGWRIEESKSRPGAVNTLKWNFMEDLLKYDVLPKTHKLKMPVLLIVGDRDNSTPVDHQKMLFERLPGEKEMHIIKGASHTFYDENHLSGIKGIFKKWIKKYQ